MLKNKIKTLLWIFFNVKNPLRYLAIHTGLLTNKEYLISLRNGTSFIIRPRTADQLFIQEIHRYKIYTKNFTLPKDGTVIDIGANIGIFSIYASTLCPKGMIYGFEPLPENISQFQKNIDINKKKNVSCLPFAVGRKNTYRTLHISSHSGSHSFYASNQKKLIIGTTIVKTFNLNTFIQDKNIKNISLLKLDCEGAECEILSSLSAETWRNIERLSLEYHSIKRISSIGKIVSIIKKRGFTILIDRDHYMIYAWKN